MKTRIRSKLAKAKIASEDGDSVGILFRTTAGRRAVWQSLAQAQGTTLTEVIQDLLNTWAGADGEVGNRSTKQVVRGAEQRKREEAELQEKVEKMELLQDAELYCWPCGEIRRVGVEERLARGLGKQISWVDEAGRCYDADLYQWEPSGGYSSELQVGGGSRRYMATIVPSVLRGWRPKLPLSERTKMQLKWIASRNAEVREALGEEWCGAGGWLS